MLFLGGGIPVGYDLVSGWPLWDWLSKTNGYRGVLSRECARWEIGEKAEAYRRAQWKAMAVPSKCKPVRC